MSAPTYHRGLMQGTDEWLAARCGLITASEVGLLLTPKLMPAANMASRAHLFELVAQRVTGHVEPRFITDDMLRGMNDEAVARALYAQHSAPVEECGFITRDFTHDGVTFTLGCSPDGLVGEDGLIEIKSRRQKFQVETFLAGDVPVDYRAQVHCALLVTGRAWLDFVSYSAGLPLFVCRVHADPGVAAAILDAAAMAEEAMAEMVASFALLSEGCIPTERTIEQEMII